MDYDESFFSAMEIKNNPHLKISLYVHLGTMNGARAGNVQCVRQGFDVLLVRLVLWGARVEHSGSGGDHIAGPMCTARGTRRAHRRTVGQRKGGEEWSLP